MGKSAENQTYIAEAITQNLQRAYNEDAINSVYDIFDLVQKTVKSIKKEIPTGSNPAKKREELFDALVLKAGKTNEEAMAIVNITYPQTVKTEEQGNLGWNCDMWLQLIKPLVTVKS